MSESNGKVEGNSNAPISQMDNDDGTKVQDDVGYENDGLDVGDEGIGNVSSESDKEVKRERTPPPAYAEVVDSNESQEDKAISKEQEAAAQNTVVRNSQASPNDDANEQFDFEEDNSKWYHIDRDLLPCKLAYFFDQAKEASIWPYLVLFQVNVGLSTFQAGTINGLRFVGCLIGGPLWGMVADQKRAHRQLAIMITICAVVLQCSQPFWAEVFGPDYMNCCPIRINGTIKDQEARAARGEVPNQKMFVALLLVSMVACLFDGTTLSFVDSGVQKRIKTINKPVDFGKQRMFGSAGYALGSVFSSEAIKLFPKANISCFLGMFITYFCWGTCLIFAYNALFRTGSDPKDSEDGQREQAPKEEENPHVKELVGKTIKNPHIIFFLFTVLFNGLMRALVFSFTYLYLQELGAPTIVLGTSMVVSQAASLTIYSLTDKIIQMAGGTMQVMAISCFSWVIRLICLAYMKSYWLIYPINILNGVSASLFVAASIIHVRKTCPPVAFTTMYGIRNSLFNGGGYIIANVVGGELYQLYGAKKLFLFTCFFCCVWVSVMVAYIVKFRNVTLDIAQETDVAYHKDTNGEPGRIEMTKSQLTAPVKT